MTLQVTLYTRPGCHLCEQAVVELNRLQHRRPHVLQEVDITTDPDLLRKYGERIPLISIRGREHAAPLPRSVLERALAEGESHAS